METQLSELRDSARAAIAAAEDLKALDALRVKFLGKKGELTEVLKNVGNLTAEEKPKIGKVVNEIKQELQYALNEKAEHLQKAALTEKMTRETVDITLKGRCDAVGALHPVTQVKARVVQLFTALGFKMVEGPEVEDDYHNFTALNIPETHPARAMADTFYFGDGRLLRTHTSPVQIREMENQGVPVRLIALGRVYRRDSDQTHTPMFHQVEGLVIEKRCSFTDLRGLLQQFLNHFFEKELTIRFRPSFFPFTEPSAEVDIYKPETKGWLEVLGCGMVHPNVLKNVGVDPDEYGGYAFGIGLDRLAMLRYHIPDLRLLFENDIRFLQQF
ncbi:MAG: phenylalanine--tRNA ligase subunit alpha [Coxiella sp. RIFCSPHIGHO2_12_FULL_42_15]|nr:MAG: phenylalanine--tRNA ligase subunit alpha [Coxiella sp. RIFCSPHIGHO2_12_FULL_42_15]